MAHVIHKILSLELCPEIRDKLHDYLHVIDMISNKPETTIQDVAHLMLTIVGKAIHAENYPSVDAFMQYLVIFFNHLYLYIEKYNNIRNKRAQDIDTYNRLCRKLFLQSTPCFELLFEQLVDFTANLHEKMDDDLVVDPARIDFELLFRSPEIREMATELKRKIVRLRGELFFIRLTRNFQIFLCRIFGGSCEPSQKKALHAIERAYNIENLYNFMYYSDYFGSLRELDGIDFPDELLEKMRAHEVDLVEGVDYLLVKICCED